MDRNEFQHGLGMAELVIRSKLSLITPYLSINYKIQIFVTQFREDKMVKNPPKMTTLISQNQHPTMFSVRKNDAISWILN
jgi:hypothetical protein